MKPGYFELLSPDPVQVPSVGGIKSPTLREISSLGYNTYRHYLAVLSLDLDSYLSMTGMSELYALLSEEEKNENDLVRSAPVKPAILRADSEHAGLFYGGDRHLLRIPAYFSGLR